MSEFCYFKDFNRIVERKGALSHNSDYSVSKCLVYEQIIEPINDVKNKKDEWEQSPRNLINEISAGFFHFLVVLSGSQKRGILASTVVSV